MTLTEPETQPPPVPSPPHDLVRVAIPLGVALIVGVFVALGIEGDVLARLIRNSPAGVILTFVAAMVGVTLPLLVARTNRAWSYILAGVLLLAASALAVWTGVNGLGEREQPDLDLGVLDVNADGLVSLKFEATALSLRSSDRMLLRVVAVRADAPADRIWRECTSVSVPGATTNKYSSVLFWGDGAPDSKGTARSSIDLGVSRGEYAYVCAYSVLSSRQAGTADANSGKTTADPRDRRTAVVLDLSSARDPVPVE